MNITGILHLHISTGLLLFSICFAQSAQSTMTVSGPITATGVTVTGDVMMSSMTISTVTISDLLNVSGAITGITHRILQMEFSSTTIATSVSTTSFTPISNIANSITLSNANNYIHLSLSGSLYTETSCPGGSNFGWITIYRDSTNLGDVSKGLVTAFSFCDSLNNIYPGSSPVGISIIDSPGDMVSHTYQAYIRSGPNADITTFPDHGVGYLLLEEVSQ